MVELKSQVVAFVSQKRSSGVLGGITLKDEFAWSNDTNVRAEAAWFAAQSCVLQIVS
jgi:hypothetical protein